jgi:hypothetical protein
MVSKESLVAELAKQFQFPATLTLAQTLTEAKKRAADSD